MTLLGAEQVQSAGHQMASAADTMMRAASYIDETMRRHQQFMDDWLRRFQETELGPRVLQIDGKDVLVIGNGRGVDPRDLVGSKP